MPNPPRDGSIPPSTSFPVTDLYAHAIRTPEHAGKALRALCLPLVGRVLRAIVATLPASFWVNVILFAVRLVPYFTGHVYATANDSTWGMDVKQAIEETR